MAELRIDTISIFPGLTSNSQALLGGIGRASKTVYHSSIEYDIFRTGSTLNLLQFKQTNKKKKKTKTKNKQKHRKKILKLKATVFSFLECLCLGKKVKMEFK